MTLQATRSTAVLGGSVEATLQYQQWYSSRAATQHSHAVMADIAVLPCGTGGGGGTSCPATQTTTPARLRAQLVRRPLFAVCLQESIALPCRFGDRRPDRQATTSSAVRAFQLRLAGRGPPRCCCRRSFPCLPESGRPTNLEACYANPFPNRDLIEAGTPPTGHPQRTVAPR
jgi:hypothetical protein